MTLNAVAEDCASGKRGSWDCGAYSCGPPGCESTRYLLNCGAEGTSTFLVLLGVGACPRSWCSWGGGGVSTLLVLWGDGGMSMFLVLLGDGGMSTLLVLW